MYRVEYVGIIEPINRAGSRSNGADRKVNFDTVLLLRMSTGQPSTPRMLRELFIEIGGSKRSNLYLFRNPYLLAKRLRQPVFPEG